MLEKKLIFFCDKNSIWWEIYFKKQLFNLGFKNLFLFELVELHYPLWSDWQLCNNFQSNCTVSGYDEMVENFCDVSNCTSNPYEMKMKIK